MDEDHKQAFDTAVEGHNLVITGQGGSGKTFVGKQHCKYVMSMGKNVQITSSTGISASHYGELGAITLHKFAGISDGRHFNREITEVISSDERYDDTKKRIIKTDVLIIDEVSMISIKVLSQVKFLIRHVRKIQNLFGNMQVILVGDFYQLPPISNELHGNFGHYCFETKFLNSIFCHKSVLNEVHRQERELILAVNSLENVLL